MLFRSVVIYMLVYVDDIVLADTSLFIFAHQGVMIYMLVYVDDIVLAGSSSSAVESLLLPSLGLFLSRTLGAWSIFLVLRRLILLRVWYCRSTNMLLISCTEPTWSSVGRLPLLCPFLLNCPEIKVICLVRKIFQVQEPCWRFTVSYSDAP